MANQAGESNDVALKPDFDRRVMPSRLLIYGIGCLADIAGFQ
jgi:hypothetical protein